MVGGNVGRRAGRKRSGPASARAGTSARRSRPASRLVVVLRIIFMATTVMVWLRRHHCGREAHGVSLWDEGDSGICLGVSGKGVPVDTRRACREPAKSVATLELTQTVPGLDFL